MSNNGEQWLLNSVVLHWSNISEGRPRIVFDIGANVGDYSAAIFKAAERFNVGVQIHAFEPGTATRQALIERFKEEPRLHVEGVAVGQNRGKQGFHSEKELSQHASLFKRASIDSGRHEVVDVARLDEFLDDKEIAHVDFIKLDVEGAELAALRGLGSKLNPRQISMIQFEYGGTTLDAGARLKDFFDLFESRGFIVAKLMPSSLVARRYSVWMDHFWYANYVAIDASKLTINTVK